MKNENLKLARDKAGLTQVETANKANVSERVYQSYENEGMIPNVHIAQLIAKALNSTVEELFPVVIDNPNS